MEWLYNLFFEQTALQAVVIISLIISTGLALGKIHVCGISLGVTFVFFMGIFAGHLGFAIDPQMLNYAESFGLVLFVPKVSDWYYLFMPWDCKSVPDSSVRSGKEDIS